MDVNASDNIDSADVTLTQRKQFRGVGNRKRAVVLSTPALHVKHKNLKKHKNQRKVVTSAADC